MKKLFTLFVLALAAVTAYGQVTTSGISGKITDANGTELIGATVIAVHTASGTRYATAADARGNYRLTNMRPGGPYTITFQMIGYSPTEMTDVTLALADNFVADAVLQEGSVGMDAIVVSATGSSTDRSGVVTAVGREGISLTPSVNRSINDVMRYTPQSTSTSNGTAIGGGNYRSSYVTVDGAAFNNTFGIGQNLPASGSPISLDALEQISISTTPFDVRQSGFTGGAINAVTRSGDNEFRGAAYSFFTNDNFRGTKTKEGMFDKDESKTNTFGVRLGGPIIKDKLFFFVNAEYDYNISPGNLSRARKSDTDSYGSNNVNRPTVDQMEGVKQYLIDKYGYNPGEYEDYSVKTPGYKILGRIDWNINDDHRLNIRYSNTKSKYSANPSNSVPVFTSKPYSSSAYRSGTNGLIFSNSRYYQEQNFSSVAAELNSNFGPVTNMFRVTYSHQDEPRSWDGGNFPTVDILESGTPLMNLGLDPFTYGNFREVKTTIVTDEVSWNWGFNNMIGGFQYEFDRTWNGYMPGGYAYYMYDNLQDFYDDKASAFSITHANNEGLKQAIPSFDYHQYSIYLQDKMDLSDRFKLTVGVRMEIPTFPSIKDNVNDTFNALDFGGKKYDTSTMPKARVQWSPRLGFNWDITGDRQFVIRGGTGIYTGRIPFVWIVSAIGNSNVQQYSYSTTTAADIPALSGNVNDIIKELHGGSFTPGTLVAPENATIMDRKLKMPQTWKSSLAFDTQLPGGINATIEGIYSKNLTQVVVESIGLKDYDEGGLELSPYDKRDKYNGYYNQNANGRNVVPYLIRNGGKKGWYYSLTAKLEKSFNFGLSTMVAYTFSDSRSTNDGIGDQVSSAFRTNTESVNGVNRFDLGYSSYVSPHRLIAGVSYKHKGTSISLFYEGSNLGYLKGTNYSYTRYTYSFTGNVVGDGGGANLLYVPASKSEIDPALFVDYVANGVVTYTKEQQVEDYWNFIEQDKYLRSHKGKYTKRNAVVMPWRSTFDLKFSQDYYIDTRSGVRNTLQFGFDIMNVGNLLNKKWGNIKQVNKNTPLAYGTFRDSVTNTNINSTPGYQFQKDGSDTLTKTYSVAERYASTYFIQISFRYIFN